MLADAFDTPWIELRRFDHAAVARDYALVLAAMDIACRLTRRDDGIGLEVLTAEALRAEYELAAYDEENRPEAAPAGRSLSIGLEGAALYCALAVFIHAAASGQWFGRDWWNAGSAQSGLILEGQWWRAFTALGLHADTGHLIGNLVLGSLFAMLLAERLGTGFAWLAILLAGGAGNALNALMQPASHTAIGASTAVFGALGLLAALGWRRDATRRTIGSRRWLPLAGGLILLSFLGVGGERTDVLAHISGFAFGILLGTILHFVHGPLHGRRLLRPLFGTAALGLFAVAWLEALGTL